MNPLLTLGLSGQHNLTIATSILALLILISLTKKLIFSGLLMDVTAALMIIYTTLERKELVSSFGRIKQPQGDFTEYCLVSWIGSIVLESRSIFYIIRMLTQTKGWNWDTKSYLSTYFPTASTTVLVLHYSTYIHRLLGEAENHVMLMFILTALTEAGKLFIQGLLFCKLLFPSYHRFSSYERSQYPWLLRLAFSNFVFLINSILLLVGMTNFRDTYLVVEPSWNLIHRCVMMGDILMRAGFTYLMFGCYISNLRNDEELFCNINFLNFIRAVPYFRYDNRRNVNENEAADDAVLNLRILQGQRPPNEIHDEQLQENINNNQQIKEIAYYNSADIEGINVEEMIIDNSLASNEIRYGGRLHSYAGYIAVPLGQTLPIHQPHDHIPSSKLVLPSSNVRMNFNIIASSNVGRVGFKTENKCMFVSGLFERKSYQKMQQDDVAL